MEFQKRQVLMKSRKKAAAKMEELQEAAQIQLSLQDQVGLLVRMCNLWYAVQTSALQVRSLYLLL